MTRTLCNLVVGTAALISVGSTADTIGAGLDVPGLPAEVREALVWFETLDYPTVDNKRFVRIDVREAGVAPREARSVTMHGYVLAQYENRYSILANDLRLLDLRVTPADTILSIEDADLEEYAARVLQNSAAYDEACAAGFCWDMGLDWSIDRYPLGLAPFALDFILARSCLKQGLIDKAVKLAERSVATKLRLSDKGEQLKHELASHICVVLTDRAMAALANSRTSRRDVLARVEWIMANFPKGYERERAELMSRILRRMVAEDDAQAWNKLVPDGRLNAPELLVYFLRDQTTFDWSDEPGVKSPARQLVELGPEAVPALIEAVGDDRFTRMVRTVEPPTVHSVDGLSIGHCAYRLLVEIWGEAPPGSYRFWSDKPEEIERTRAILRHYWETKSRRASSPPGR